MAVILSDALHDQIRGQVDHERDGEEQDADEKQHLVMIGTFAVSPKLRGDGGGERANRIEDAVRNIDRVSGGHEHRHRFADGASDAEQHGGEQSVFRGGQQDAIDELPRVQPRARPLRDRNLARLSKRLRRC